MKDVPFVRENYRGETEVCVVQTASPQWVARMATRLVEHFGCIACVEDGEDSSGRQKLRLATPEELVSRCCAIADLMVNECHTRGWMLELPLPTNATSPNLKIPGLE